MALLVVRTDRRLSLIAAVVLSATYLYQLAQGHPLCFVGDTNPVTDALATFCPNEDPDGFCCDESTEALLESTLEESGATETCAALYKEVLCGLCHPYSAHLFERLNTMDGLTMTNEFCDEFFTACESELALASDYCEIHTGGDVDQYWSYPLVIDDSFEMEGLTKAFPSLPDEDLPLQPIDMHMTPDGTKWWVAGMEGEIKELEVGDPGIAITVVNITDRINRGEEEGLIGFAFSPAFTTTGVFYLSYTAPGAEGEFAANRLSKMIYDPSSPTATADSEEVLITTTSKYSAVHSSGWVGFKPSSYADPTAAFHDLFWTVGDGGPQDDPNNSGQDPTMFHGSVVRISVPSDVGATGYEIPADNPFASGGGLGEICAKGFRNPFRCGFDRETDELFCGDVGHLSLESVKLVECGNNYGWRQFEGERCSDQIEDEFEPCETADRSPYTFPIYQYCHPNYYPADYEPYLVDQDICGDRTIVGGAVIGGNVYRGSKYADFLGGHYIFAEHELQSLNHLVPTASGRWDYGTITNDTVPNIVSFGEDNDGEQYIIGYSGSIYELPCGCLCDNSCPETSTASPTAASPVETPPPTMAASPTSSPEPSPTGRTSPASPTVPPASSSPTEPVPTGQEGGDGDGSGLISDPEFCSGVYDEDVVPLQDTPAEVYAEHMGCWADDKTAHDARALQLAFLDDDMMNPVMCEMFCKDVGADIFGLQYGTQCLCGDSRDADYKQYGRTVCEFPCSGLPTASCGGYLGSDIYFIGGGPPVPVGSEYLGCMMDKKDSKGARAILDGFLRCKGTMTTAMCEHYCRGLGSVVYGLQYGYECFCGEEYDHDQYGEGRCNYRCDGDLHATCGGYLAQNVYALN